MSVNEKYQAGESYGTERKSATNLLNDPTKLATDLLKDYAGLRGKVSVSDLVGLLAELTQKGQPLDDKKG